MSQSHLLYICPALPLPEKKLIARVRQRTPAAAPSVARSIGDDCAVLRLPPNHEVLITTDFSLEEVHFRRAWHPPESIGHRCLARGLSDIAAMGGEPLAAFLSLALPGSLSQRWVDRFMSGFLELAREYKVPLAGGDIAGSPAGVLADIVVLGVVPKGKSILRSGAQPGDSIYVTGVLGGSAAALATLRSGRKLAPRSYPEHFFPTPRLRVGRELRERRLASAMIDLSDGLSTDLAHVCEESGVGAVLRASSIPTTEGGGAAGFALHGGEDYELLFTSGRKVPGTLAGVVITRIGEVTARRGIRIMDAAGRSHRFEPRGWEHFRANH